MLPPTHHSKIIIQPPFQDNQASEFSPFRSLPIPTLNWNRIVSTASFLYIPETIFAEPPQSRLPILLPQNYYKSCILRITNGHHWPGSLARSTWCRNSLRVGHEMRKSMFMFTICIIAIIAQSRLWKSRPADGETLSLTKDHVHPRFFSFWIQMLMMFGRPRRLVWEWCFICMLGIERLVTRWEKSFFPALSTQTRLNWNVVGTPVT